MVTESNQGCFEFALEWQSLCAKHTDRHYFFKLNYWRDIFPGNLASQLPHLKIGESIEQSFPKGVLVDAFNKNKIFRVPKRTLNLDRLNEKGVHLASGRFYPRSAFSSVGFTPQDVRPVRIVASDEESLTLDSNHPLHPFSIKVRGQLLRSLPERNERGGHANDIGYTITMAGPGLQAGISGQETDFYINGAFTRDDEKSDQVFYKNPRMVNHIDETARQQIGELYGRFLKPGSRILDLMASWNSHYQLKPGSAEVVGLGLNEEELAANPLLTESVLQDLNSQPILPFPDNHFDAATCTVSIEYLIDPVTVLNEVARVLKPGGVFVITFSDRWFPPKAINLWKELHPFERVALVIDYFKKSGDFTGLQTESIRGYPRPVSDWSPSGRSHADPVFAVWASVKEG